MPTYRVLVGISGRSITLPLTPSQIQYTRTIFSREDIRCSIPSCGRKLQLRPNHSHKILNVRPRVKIIERWCKKGIRCMLVKEFPFDVEPFDGAKNA